MCLGIPGKVTSLSEPENGLVMGKVDFGGIEREVCFGYTPEAKVGDYVLVHVGFALSVLDPESAHQILSDLAEIERLGTTEEPPSGTEGRP
jgi:hydrogenase expression/formation protein HypC